MKKIIPCLDTNKGRVVKGVNFVNLVDVGDPVEIAQFYEKEGADELCFLDITATNENRKTTVELAKKVANSIKIPLIVGGGIKTIDDIKALLDAGVSKISINSAAIKTPNLINEAAKEFNSLIVAIDVKKVNNNYNVFINGGEVDSGKEALKWALEVQDRGAAEILPTSMDRDGVTNGYDLEITGLLAKELNIPVIASGGAGRMSDFLDAFRAGVSSALAASVFHFGTIRINELKKYLLENGVKVRI